MCCSNLDPVKRWKVHSGQGKFNIKFNIMFKHKELLNMTHVEYIGYSKTPYGILGLRSIPKGRQTWNGGSSPSLEITFHWRRCRRTYKMAEKFANLPAPEPVCRTRAGLQLKGKQEGTLWSTSLWKGHSWWPQCERVVRTGDLVEFEAWSWQCPICRIRWASSL